MLHTIGEIVELAVESPETAPVPDPSTDHGRHQQMVAVEMLIEKLKVQPDKLMTVLEYGERLGEDARARLHMRLMRLEQFGDELMKFPYRESVDRSLSHVAMLREAYGRLVEIMDAHRVPEPEHAAWPFEIPLPYRGKTDYVVQSLKNIPSSPASRKGPGR